MTCNIVIGQRRKRNIFERVIKEKKIKQTNVNIEKLFNHFENSLFNITLRDFTILKGHPKNLYCTFFFLMSEYCFNFTLSSFFSLLDFAPMTSCHILTVDGEEHTVFSSWKDDISTLSAKATLPLKWEKSKLFPVFTSFPE